MLASSDIVCLPYTPDLTEAGIQVALRDLPRMHVRPGGSLADRLRRRTAETAAELAFRRYLASESAPFAVRRPAPFSEAERYAVLLDGHACEIQAFLISHRHQMASLHEQPAQLLQAEALVPLDQHVSDGSSPSDLYVFCFVAGLVARSAAELERAMAAGRPLYWVHPMPDEWVRPRTRAPLSPLRLKSEAREPLTVEVGGQDARGEFLMRTLDLAARRVAEAEAGLCTVAYLHAPSRPDARLAVRSALHGEAYVVPPTAWHNIWVDGMRVYLAGWITRDEFRRGARLLPEGSRTFAYDRTRTKNLAMPIARLHSVRELVERAHASPH